MYYVLASKRRKRLLVTQSFAEAGDFLLANKDTKIRTMEYDIKARIMDRRVFLKEYYTATEDKIKFFQLVHQMIKGHTNVYDLINLFGLREEYRVFVNNFDKML